MYHSMSLIINLKGKDHGKSYESVGVNIIIVRSSEDFFNTYVYKIRIKIIVLI